MTKRIPFLSLCACIIIGILLGFLWKNYAAGLLLGLGVGIILMVLLRFLLLINKKKDKEISAEDPQES